MNFRGYDHITLFSFFFFVMRYLYVCYMYSISLAIQHAIEIKPAHTWLICGESPMRFSTDTRSRASGLI